MFNQKFSQDDISDSSCGNMVYRSVISNLHNIVNGLDDHQQHIVQNDEQDRYHSQLLLTAHVYRILFESNRPTNKKFP